MAIGVWPFENAPKMTIRMVVRPALEEPESEVELSERNDVYRLLAALEMVENALHARDHRHQSMWVGRGSVRLLSSLMRGQ
jgi:hypothetical protein